MSNFQQEFKKRDLYNFDDTYLKELNSIRKQLNLLEISDENTKGQSVELSDISISSPSKNEFKPELYEETNSDYLSELNAIRRELNFDEIGNENDLDVEKTFTHNSEKTENVYPVLVTGKFNNIILNKNRKKVKHQLNKFNDQNLDEILQLTYTPPKKKICVEKSLEEKSNDVNHQQRKAQSNGSIGNNGTETVCENISPKSILKQGNDARCSDQNMPKITENKINMDQMETETDLRRNKEEKKQLDSHSPVSGPSEDSSPVLSQHRPKNLTVSVFNPEYYCTKPVSKLNHFCSLNVPNYCCEEQRPSLKSKTTVLSNQIQEDEKLLLHQDNDTKPHNVITIFNKENFDDEDNLSMIASSMDLPRKSEIIHNEFPSIVNITKWPLAFAQYNINNIYVNISEKQNAIRKHRRSSTKPSDDRRSKNDLIAKKKSTPEEENIEAKSALKVMFHRVDQQISDGKFHKVEAEEDLDVKIENSEPDVEEAEQNNCKPCGCFRICFKRKPRQYFS